MNYSCIKVLDMLTCFKTVGDSRFRGYRIYYNDFEISCCIEMYNFNCKPLAPHIHERFCLLFLIKCIFNIFDLVLYLGRERFRAIL